MTDDVERELTLGAVARLISADKYLILAFAVASGVSAAIYAFTATPLYRAEVAVTEAHESGPGSGVGAISSQLGGLASLAGVNIGASASLREAQAVLASRYLVQDFIVSNALVSVLVQDEKGPQALWLAVERFRTDVLTIREDKVKGVTTLSVDWSDPVVSARWANGIVALANDLLRSRAMEESTRSIAYLNEQISHTNVVEVQRTMYNLIESQTKTLMLANSRIDYAFAVVDPAVVPAKRFSPKRIALVLSSMVAGTFLGIIAAFFRRQSDGRGR